MFKSIWNFILTVFSGKNFAKLADIATKAVLIGNIVKTGIIKPGFDLAILITGNQKLAGIESKVEGAITSVMTKMGLGIECTSKATVAEKILCIQILASGKPEDDKTMFWHNFTSLLGVALADGVFDLKDFFGVIEGIFRKETGKIN